MEGIPYFPSPDARKLLEAYFQTALIPYLHKKNTGFCAFTEYSLNEPVKLHVLIAYPNGSTYLNIQSEMQRMSF